MAIQQHDTVRSSDEVRDQIIDWLRDAYAMERGLEVSLKKQSENDDLRPEVRERAGQHLQETKRHAELVEQALKSLDADTSTLKTTMGRAAQATKGMGSVFSQDEHIKDLLDAYSGEHFEIACYVALEAAAQRGGYTQVAQICRQIIPDEERMAKSLLESLPREIADYLFETAHANA